MPNVSRNAFFFFFFVFEHDSRITCKAKVFSYLLYDHVSYPKREWRLAVVSIPCRVGMTLSGVSAREPF